MKTKIRILTHLAVVCSLILSHSSRAEVKAGYYEGDHYRALIQTRMVDGVQQAYAFFWHLGYVGGHRLGSVFTIEEMEDGKQAWKKLSFQDPQGLVTSYKKIDKYNPKDLGDRVVIQADREISVSGCNRLLRLHERGVGRRLMDLDGFVEFDRANRNKYFRWNFSGQQGTAQWAGSQYQGSQVLPGVALMHASTSTGTGYEISQDVRFLAVLIKHDVPFLGFIPNEIDHLYSIQRFNSNDYYNGENARCLDKMVKH